MSYYFQQSDRFTPECGLGPPADPSPSIGFSENIERLFYSAQHAESSARLIILIIFALLGVYVAKRCRSLFVNAKTPVERVGAIMICVSICLWGISFVYWNIERQPFFHGKTSSWKEELPKPPLQGGNVEWRKNRCGVVWELVDLGCMSTQRKEASNCPEALNDLLGKDWDNSGPGYGCDRQMEYQGLWDKGYWDNHDKCVLKGMARHRRVVWHKSTSVESSVNEFVNASFSGGRFNQPYWVLNWIALTLIAIGSMFYSGIAKRLLGWIKNG